MARLHLIHGFLGAGKTHFAKKIEADTGAVRFSHDEWMARLYGPNPPESEFQIYAGRVSAVIWEMAATLLKHKVDVIMDFGFWSRAERDGAFAFGDKHGAEVILYNVTCPESLMRERVLRRTSELPTGSLVIDENAFDNFKIRFHALEDDEDHLVIDTSLF